MNINREVKSLIDVLDADISIYRNLLDTINSEYGFLVDKDYDAISKHIELKKQFYSEIVSNEKKREEIILKLGKESVSQILDIIKDDYLAGELKLKRDTMTLLIARISEANERNKNFVDHSRKVFQSVINNIKDLVLSDVRVTYGSDAKMDKRTTEKNAVLLNKGV